VLEPLGGYLVLAKRLYEEGPKFYGGWNFGPRDQDTKTVREIVEEATRQWGGGACWEKDGGDQPHEAQYLKLDCSKAHTLLNWQPRLDVGTALAWTVEWYKSWRAGADMREFSLSQIAAYSKLSSQ
jgi:CDP-glucose 4,6-dehydratase